VEDCYILNLKKLILEILKSLELTLLNFFISH